MSLLDEHYGMPLPPQPPPGRSTAFEPWERELPSSFGILDQEGARYLSDFMAAARYGNKIVASLLGNITILWLIDENGLVRYAFEEVVYLNEDRSAWVRSGHPKLSPVDLPFAPWNSAAPNQAKVGHPALVRAGLARIGGELYPQGDGDTWILDNNSGRYGRIRGQRSKQHLGRAAELFRRVCRVDIKCDFRETFY